MSGDHNPNEMTNGIKDLKLDDNEDLVDDVELGALEKELDELNSDLDKIDNWSTSLHDKVADFLKETRQQNSNTSNHSAIDNEQNINSTSNDDTSEDKQDEKKE